MTKEKHVQFCAIYVEALTKINLNNLTDNRVKNVQ